MNQKHTMNWTKTEDNPPPNDEFVIFWNPEYKVCPFRIAKSNTVVNNKKSFFYEPNKYSTQYNTFSIDPIYWTKNDGKLYSELSMLKNQHIIIKTHNIRFSMVGKWITDKYGIKQYIFIKDIEQKVGPLSIDGWSYLPKEPINNKKIVKRYEILDI